MLAKEGLDDPWEVYRVRANGKKCRHRGWSGRHSWRLVSLKRNDGLRRGGWRWEGVSGVSQGTKMGRSWGQLPAKSGSFGRSSQGWLGSPGDSGQKTLNARLWHLFWVWGTSREPEIPNSQGHSGNLALTVFLRLWAMLLFQVLKLGRLQLMLPADDLMKSTYFYANPTFSFLPELGPSWEYNSWDKD